MPEFTRDAVEWAIRNVGFYGCANSSPLLDAIMLLYAATRPKYTKETPTNHGWYWYRQTPKSTAFIVLFQRGEFYSVFTREPLPLSDGEWCRVEEPAAAEADRERREREA